MKVALVHDWLVGMRGGERVLESFCELFPQADLYTLVHAPQACSASIERMSIHTSFINGLPWAKERYRHYLALFPHAIESFNFNGYDLVLSSSHCVAKGVITSPQTLHISYVHTPMRYLWDQYGDYFGKEKAGTITRVGARICSTFLRTWDEASAQRVDLYLANSSYVASRIRKRYGRRSLVVPPPVDISRFTVSEAEEVEDFYLMVTAFAPYKKVEIAIEAFRRLNRPLRIVGGGQERRRIEGLVGGSVQLLGSLNDAEVANLYKKCRALIFPGEEDAGITPLEAQACGRPVIALGKGGALETVVGLNSGQASPTGVFFSEPTVELLKLAVDKFEQESHRFDPLAARKNAERFDKKHFQGRIMDIVEKAQSKHQEEINLSTISRNKFRPEDSFFENE